MVHRPLGIDYGDTSSSDEEEAETGSELRGLIQKNFLKSYL